MTGDWDAAEPGKGYDAKAAEWRKKLEEQTPKLENAETPKNQDVETTKSESAETPNP